ncbi:FtsB family cell division protein [Yunchengibacter salinarum]|uniref:FtsB family cell division protein n=1 Tax=Yunchengibacter salinarum TaxID=3133399 RepID=UPI0035B65B82
MKTGLRIKRHVKDVWLAGVWLAVMGYFAVHAFQGDNSLSVLKTLEARESALAEKAAHYQATRARLERRVSHLGGSRIDPDLLDQQVRAKLGFQHSDEVVVFLPDLSTFGES